MTREIDLRSLHRVIEAESEKWWATSYTALRWHGNVWFHCSHSVILLFLQLSVVPWWRSRAVAGACPSIHYAGGRNTRVVQPPRSKHPSPTLPPRGCLEPQISLVTQHSSCVCGRNWSTPEHTFRRFCFPIKSLIVPDRARLAISTLGGFVSRHCFAVAMFLTFPQQKLMFILASGKMHLVQFDCQVCCTPRTAALLRHLCYWSLISRQSLWYYKVIIPPSPIQTEWEREV